MKVCFTCQKVLGVSEFGENKHSPDGRNRYCLACRRKKYSEKRLEDIEIKVKRENNSRCVQCDGVENLEVVPMSETKRRNFRNMVLICSHCKAAGIPMLNKYVRDCLRCKHHWLARKSVTVCCPACGSPYWNRVKE